jgi:hypothetical protein
MEEPQAQSFDDPALKAALRRALDSSGAPSALRDRIRAMAASEGPPEQPIPSMRLAEVEKAEVADRPIPLFRRAWFMRFAAAAVLILGVGSLSYQIWQANRPPAYVAAYVVPPSLYKGMTVAHDERLAGSATPSDTTSDLAAVPALSQTIQRPVFAAKLTDDGWKFEGAAVRDVGPFAAAQLFFSKGKASISVFSLPAAAVPNARDDVTYDTVFNGHPIAGFVRQGGLFCIVGSSPDGSLTVDEVKGLLESHRGEIAKG